MEKDCESLYYIITVLDKIPMLIGKTGQYVREVDNALSFGDPYDALMYVDKHGLNGMATVRPIKRNI